MRGRLTQVVSGSTTLQFTYDCFNRRVTKSTNGVLKRYVWLGAYLFLLIGGQPDMLPVFISYVGLQSKRALCSF